MPALKESVGIQSIEIGVDVLQAMARISRPATLGVIAKACGMQSNKVHRYLVSFVRTGIVAQRQGSGEYELGPTLRVLGLTAVRLMDPYQRLFERLRMLRDELQFTTLLAVWTDAGATVIGWENGVHHTSITFRLGSTLPLVRSATGRLFLAYLPTSFTKAAVKSEHELDGRSAASKLPDPQELIQIRDRGFSYSSDEILPGVAALAAPVLDEGDAIFAALALLAPKRYMQGRAVERARQTLLRVAAAASCELGHRSVERDLSTPGNSGRIHPT